MAYRTSPRSHASRYDTADVNDVTANGWSRSLPIGCRRAIKIMLMPHLPSRPAVPALWPGPLAGTIGTSRRPVPVRCRSRRSSASVPARRRWHGGRRQNVRGWRGRHHVPRSRFVTQRSDRRPRDGPAGSWTAAVTSSAPSGRRPLSHMALGMRWHRSARLGRSWALLAGRTRSSLSTFPGDGVERGGDGVPRAILSRNEGVEHVSPCHTGIPSCNCVLCLLDRLVTQQRLPNGGHDVVGRKPRLISRLDNLGNLISQVAHRATAFPRRAFADAWLACFARHLLHRLAPNCGAHIIPQSGHAFSTVIPGRPWPTCSSVTTSPRLAAMRSASRTAFLV